MLNFYLLVLLKHLKYIWMYLSDILVLFWNTSIENIPGYVLYSHVSLWWNVLHVNLYVWEDTVFQKRLIDVIYPTSANHFHGVTLDFTNTKIFTYYQKVCFQHTILWPPPPIILAHSLLCSDLSDSSAAPPVPPKYSHLTFPPIHLLRLAFFSFSTLFIFIFY